MTNLLDFVGSFISKWIVTPPSSPNEQAIGGNDWGSWQARSTRYDFFWAHYSNTQYDNLPHQWATSFKTAWNLYESTRGCYNPLYRLGEFWGTTTWGGGRLDPRKQGGRIAKSALPIMTKNDDIRLGIGTLWQDSLWQVNKDQIPRLGAVKGDVGIKIRDDTKAGQVRMEAVDPSSIRWLKLDAMGAVLAYELWERWPDPRYDVKGMSQIAPGASQRMVTYKEKCYLEDREDGKPATVVFETLLNDEPYAWNGNDAKWEEPYGFVPFVFIPNVRKLPGYPWGESEFQTGLPKTHEIDDLASKQHDYTRMAADPTWFISGSKPPATTPTMQGKTPTAYNTAPNRQERKIIYGGQGSDIKAMAYNLDLQFSSVEIQNQLASLEKDYPELRYDSARATGDASAKALREVRKAAEVKVHSRRAGYDAQLCRAQAMALAIGGMRGYPGYEGLSLEEYFNGGLNHWIGERSVFLMDPLDRIEEEQALATFWMTAKTAGIPDKIIMQRLDWSDEEIADFEAAKKEEQETAIANAKAAAPDPTAPKIGSPPKTNAA